MGVRMCLLLLVITFIQPGSASAQATIERLGDASAGAISQVAMTALGNRVVTAVRTGGGYLKLIAWQVTSGGEIERLGDATAGAIGEVAITSLSSMEGDRVVTAVRTGSGYLKLIVWQVTGQGQIERLGDATGNAIDQVAMASVGGNRVVTACRDAHSNLKLIAWDVSAQGQIQALGSAAAGAISQVAIVGLRAVGSDARMLTAVRTGSGYLKLIAWDVSAQGQIERKGDAAAGAISQVAMTFVTTLGFPPEAEVVVTAVRTSSGFLEPIAWYVDDYASGQVTRGASAVAEAISQVAASTVRPAFMPDMLVTAVATSSGLLRLIVWDVGTGDIMDSLGVADATPTISQVAVTNLAMQTRVVTAVRTNMGYLQLTVWEVKMSP
ncbi:MAG: hypothetical protein D6723_00510 [Acidobacteria bacterium]|nr:MAG: hypothetical protein D6723_00510 [Acidobacteriota bacterium]